jgi:hypothetical protein
VKINLLLAAVFLSVIIYANIDEMDGIVGLTKLDGGYGCVCHWIEPTDSVIVFIEGPDTIYAGDTAQFKISIAGGPAVVGGFNLAAYSGELSPRDTSTHLEINTATLRMELTHSFPFPFLDGEVYWLFNYVASDSITFDTLYATGNSTNGDGIPTNLDQWNHSENFPVVILDRPVAVQNEKLLPADFVLYQNYPNPFNPTTNIRFRISDFGFVFLKIYDALGNEVKTLVNENKSVGEYQVKFSANGLTSGIYYYRLETKDFSETKKMILLK